MIRTERDMEQSLHELLNELAVMDEVDATEAGVREVQEYLEGARIDTFEEAGVLTRNKGLVVRLKDGTEFQLTVVKSRSGEECAEEEEEEEDDE